MTDNVQREEERGMTADPTMLRKLCGELEDMSVWKDQVSIDELRSRLEPAVAEMEQLAAAEYARGRAEALRDVQIREVDAMFDSGYHHAKKECAATHAALEAAAEQLGEARVRKALRGLWRRHGEYIDIKGGMNFMRQGLNWSSYANEVVWWALTGEGEPPKDKG